MTETVSADTIRRLDSGALYGKPGLPLYLVETPLCRAVIAVQGAQLLEFQARGDAPLLWLSPLAEFTAGKAIRGGIPLCLPWFGIPPDASKPKHGFVRNRPWQLAGTQVSSQGQVQLVFVYRHQADNLFGADFSCRYKITLGRELKLALELENLDASATAFSWAWHSYFAVEDVASVAVRGLEQVEYLDNTRSLARASQEGTLTFAGEVDRAFECAPSRQSIQVPGLITSASSAGCDTVITWNPGAELAATIADIGPHYREFVCVEHGAAFANRWQLAPGEVRSATLTLRRE
ncbi:putative glucose-6-phosphate 1-epimerase [Microbulbifer aestuariivivens]|uniref:Putative glucose-6-phosphate 1-epimerase n=2 Tax=Microbulbifer aestuariivivens TaxID=1908308 RepID=A0ABP9WNF2_9GAMM